MTQTATRPRKRKPKLKPTCRPRYSTPRTGRPTHGPAAAEFAGALGFELMDWQRHVLDVALEYDPVTNKFAYQTVILTVPRQSGKTLLLLVLILFRLVKVAGTFGRQQAVYTAQKGRYALEKFEEDWVPLLEGPGSLFERDKDFSVRLGNSPRLKWLKGAKSTCRISATTESAGHSKTLDLVVIDEAFIHEDSRIDAGFGPPMMTRSKVAPSAQKWIVSTAGTHKSVYLNGKRKLGRQLAEVGSVDDGIAYFEWSAPDGADIEDPAVWRACMPALGHTVDEDFIARELRELVESADDPEEGRAEFRRAYLNRTIPAPDVLADVAVDPSVWDRQADRLSSMVGGVVLGVEMTPDRSVTAVSVAGRRAEGDWHGEHVKTAEGSGWVLEYLLEIAVSFDDVVGVAVDVNGPAGSLVPEILACGKLPLFKMSSGDFVRSTGATLDAVKEQRFWHYDQPDLTAAALRARVKSVGDAKVFRRGDGDESVAEFTAMALALGACSGIGELTPVEDALAAMDARGGLFEWD